MVEREESVKQFFPGFQFHLPKPWLETSGIGFVNADRTVTPATDYYPNRQPKMDQEFVATMGGNRTPTLESQKEETALSLEGEIGKFQTTAKRIKNDFPGAFPTSIRIDVVHSAKLVPQTEQQKIMMANEYGEEVVNGWDGDFHFLPFDQGLIRLGYLNKQNALSSQLLIFILSHELGHGFGKKTLVSTLAEEMKAFTFTQLFERYHYNTNVVEDIWHPLSAESLHDVAQFRVIELINSGANEEAILSHLIGEPLGEYTPSTWSSMVAINERQSYHLW